MQFSDVNTYVDFDCLIVSGSPALHSAIDQSLATIADRLLHERDAARAVCRAEELNTPVILAGYDVSWKDMLQACSLLRNQPSVVVLLPTSDPLAWADALSQGAVDALSVTADPNRVLWTLQTAYRRWERRQLVRQALDQNPMLRTHD